MEAIAEYKAAGFPESKIGAIAIAVAYLRAGEKTLALDWLEKAFEVHDPQTPYPFVGHAFDPIRSDPRFQALRRQMNLPE